MKDLSPRWAAITLLTPVILILSLILLADLNRARAAKVKTGQGTVVVGFTGSVVQVDASDNPIPNPPPLPFQHVFLNIISVRLNPSTSDIVTDGVGGWVTIPVPAGVGNSASSGFVQTGLNFGGNLGFTSQTISLGEGRSEIQIDATQLPQVPLLFNASTIRANTYNQVELVLDSSTFKITGSNPNSNSGQLSASNAGNVVPLCSSAGLATQGGSEGCVVYPVTIFDPSSTIGAAHSPVEVGRQGLVPLIVNIQVDVESPALANGGPIIIQPHISIVQNEGASQNGQPLNQDLALIQGNVSNFAANSKTVVTAELAGTNDIIEQYNVQSTGDTAGRYTLYLPAPLGGSKYDLYVSGPGRSYDLKSDVNAVPGSFIAGLDFNPQIQNTITLSGTIKDACAPTQPVEAATVELLEPDPNISPAPDCSLSNRPGGCVVVASTATDEGGTFPLPANGNSPGPFENVPTGQSYTMLVNSAGFDPLIQPVQSSGNNNLNCPNGVGNKCSFSLSHGYLAGTLQLSNPSSSPLSAMVMAEDSGTSNIENFTQLIFPPSQGTADFSIPVPDTADVSSFDIFATVQDDFEGQPQLQSMHTPQQNTGHSIAVEGSIDAPVACATSTPSAILGPVTCIGHGSLEGPLNNPTDLTSVVLEKPDANNNLVQIINGVVGPFGSDNAGGYALCAPPEPGAKYALQRFDDGVAGDAVPIPDMNTPVIVPTAAPSASFTPTPCPGICDKGQGTSCLTCVETGGPSL